MAPWLKKLRANPVTAIALDVVGEWWAHHPLKLAADVAGTAVRSAVAPIAQRHPVALVGTAAAAGALLVWGKPWRWLFKRAVLAGVLSQLAGVLISRLGDAQAAEPPQDGS